MSRGLKLHNLAKLISNINPVPPAQAVTAREGPEGEEHAAGASGRVPSESNFDSQSEACGNSKGKKNFPAAVATKWVAKAINSPPVNNNRGTPAFPRIPRPDTVRGHGALNFAGKFLSIS